MEDGRFARSSGNMNQRGKQVLQDYLEHIQLAIRRIQRYLEGIDQAGFLANEEKQDAVIRNLEIIGEASENIRRNFPDFAKERPDFPLKPAYGMRNALAHGYFKVDLEVVWKTIEKDLPQLETQVAGALASLTPNSE
jgi:uncharacterized protein with HEPN domain